MIVSDFHYELYKEIYYKEIEQKEALNSRINIPLGVLTLIAGSAIYFTNNCYSIPAGNWRCGFIMAFSLHIALLITSAVLIFKSYYGYGYLYIPIAKDIDNFSTIYRQYYDENYEAYFSQRNKTKEELMETDVKNRLLQIYMEAASNNREENFRKIKYLRFVSWSLIAVLFSGAITLFTHTIATGANENVQKIEIVNSNPMNDIKGGSKMSDDPKTASQQQHPTSNAGTPSATPSPTPSPQANPTSSPEPQSVNAKPIASGPPPKPDPLILRPVMITESFSEEGKKNMQAVKDDAKEKHDKKG